MIFNTGVVLLDAIVPAVGSWDRKGTHSCKITQDMPKNEILDVAEELLMAHTRAISDGEGRT